jgi:hypothetical protein
VQVGVAPEHAWPQAPQFVELVATLVSQPSAATPLQSAKPWEQATMRQVVMAQPDVALAKEHTSPQAPQLLGSFWRLASQPSIGFVLQSAKPGLQAKTHAAAAQLGRPFWTIGQTLPQAPQF